MKKMIVNVIVLNSTTVVTVAVMIVVAPTVGRVMPVRNVKGEIKMVYGIFLNEKLTYYTNNKGSYQRQLNYCKQFKWLNAEGKRIKLSEVHEGCWTC